MNHNFHPPTKALTASDFRFLVVAALVVLAFCAGMISINLKLKGGGEFFIHYIGIRVKFQESINPYESQVPLSVRQLVYEGAYQQGDEPYLLDTPFQLLILYYPFIIIHDPALARSLFTLTLELALFALALLSVSLSGWQVTPLVAFAFILFTTLNYYTFQAIQQASPVIWLALIYVGIILAYRAGADELAGALAAFCLYYWEVGALFLFLLFWRALHEKRRRLIVGFLMMNVILFSISFLIFPGWIIPYLRAAVNNLSFQFGYDLRTILATLFPGSGTYIAWAVIAALILALGYEWMQSINSDFRDFYWVVCLSLAAAPLLSIRSEMENLMVLVIPLTLVFSIIYERWSRFGHSLFFFLLALLFSLPWVLVAFYQQRLGAVVLDWVFLLLPVFTIAGLYWVRWWALRPPRVFSDYAHRPA